MLEMTNNIRYGLYGVLIGAIGAATAMLLIAPKPFTKIETVTVTQTIEKKVDVKTNKRTTSQKKKVKPDGTVETSITTTDENALSIDVLKAEGSTKSSVSTSTDKARYSLGASLIYRPDIWKEISYKDVRVDVGIRLGNLPVWLEGGIKLDKTISLGSRFEF